MKPSARIPLGSEPGQAPAFVTRVLPGPRSTTSLPRRQTRDRWSGSDEFPQVQQGQALLTASRQRLADQRPYSVESRVRTRTETLSALGLVESPVRFAAHWLMPVSSVKGRALRAGLKPRAFAAGATVAQRDIDNARNDQHRNDGHSPFTGAGFRSPCR